MNSKQLTIINTVATKQIINKMQLCIEYANKHLHDLNLQTQIDALTDNATWKDIQHKLLDLNCAALVNHANEYMHLCECTIVLDIVKSWYMNAAYNDALIEVISTAVNELSDLYKIKCNSNEDELLIV